MPVLRLRSSSAKTSWMPSSRSGPSIAMSARHLRAENALEIRRRPDLALGATREVGRGSQLDDPPPALDRLAIPMLFGQQRALMKERTDVVRVESQDARERSHRVLLAIQRQQRLAERDERVEVIRIALQQLDEQGQHFR